MMLIREGKKYYWLLAIAATFSLSPALVSGESSRSERWDRTVDIVARSAQNKAIAKYRKLIVPTPNAHQRAEKKRSTALSPLRRHRPTGRSRHFRGLNG